ncbi:hypothetical protein [Pseudolactococcus hodotermopsidis]|nr:hypothetical protein [Lactococcus hodotermopsidis]
MDNYERQQFEDAHDNNIRLFNEAEQIINDYRREANQKTSQLVDYVSSFYQNLPDGVPRNLSFQFEEKFNEYDRVLKKKEEELEVARDEERRDFNQKMEW